jgi:putative RecB family exonuclease
VTAFGVGELYSITRLERPYPTHRFTLPADAPREVPGVVGAGLYASLMSQQPGAERSRPALSPSRASDFKQCPLLYRFRAIDRLPEPTSTAQLRGSVVHAALEQLYALPAPERLPEAAISLVTPAWERVVEAEPDLADSVSSDERDVLLDEARMLLSGYYRLEDPTRFDPQSCEQRVEVELEDGTLLRGFIDRIDVAATGELRVVDYKTGKSPPEARALAEFKAMFQMKFYAVALFRTRGVVPTRLRLLYLADSAILDYSPDLDELLRFEKTLMAIWRAIQSAGATGDFRPSPSRLCDWCAHHSRCPAFGGTPPPYPGWPEALQEGGEDTVLQSGSESAA